MDYVSNDICKPSDFFTIGVANSICHRMDNNIDYYRKKIPGMTVEALAKKLDISREYLQDLKAGRKPGGFTVALLERMGNILGCTAAQLLEKPRQVRNIGVVTAGGVVELLLHSEESLVDVPPEASGKPIASVCIFADDSNAPMAFEGWKYYLGPTILGGIEDYSNTFYLVQILDGKTLIRRIRPGRSKGKYSLLGSSDLIDDISIEWCAPVLFIEPS
jgi:transcriptional regulator with XRE-family HTH domain